MFVKTKTLHKSINPNDNPESVISVACFMVDIYLVLVKIVVLTLSSKVCRCTFSKPAANITSVVVYNERQRVTAGNDRV